MGARDPAGGGNEARPGASVADVRAVVGPGDRMVIVLSGEVDLSNVDGVERQIGDAIAGAASVAMDLNAVTYLDSRGLRLLLRLIDRHLHQSLDLVIVASPDSIAHELLVVSGLMEAVPVIPALG